MMPGAKHVTHASAWLEARPFKPASPEVDLRFGATFKEIAIVLDFQHANGTVEPCSDWIVHANP